MTASARECRENDVRYLNDQPSHDRVDCGDLKDFASFGQKRTFTTSDNRHFGNTKRLHSRQVNKILGVSYHCLSLWRSHR